MKYQVTLNGKVYEVEVEKGEAQLVDVQELAAMTPSAPAAAVVAGATVAAPSATPAAAVSVSGGEPVLAPMPGNVLSIKVKAGDTVKKGDLLLLLEAMKMENEIFAPRDAKIVQVVAAPGQTVDTGAPLVVLG